jgi:hypothetical protein
MAATGVPKTGSVAETHIVFPSAAISSILSAIGLANAGDRNNRDNRVCKGRIVFDESIKLLNTDRPSMDEERNLRLREAGTFKKGASLLIFSMICRDSIRISGFYLNGG